jgi:arabinonate dehydratase
MCYPPVSVSPDTKDLPGTIDTRDSSEQRTDGSPIGRMLVLAVGDNVGVVVTPVPVGGILRTSSGQSVMAVSDVPAGHKIALEDLPKSSGVRKYGVLIGVTTRLVRQGEHLHVHNAESQRLRGDLAAISPAHLGAQDGE